MVRTLTPYVEQGQIGSFSVNGVTGEPFYNKSAHPFTAAGRSRSTTPIW